MLKFIIILILLIYVLNKVSVVLFRMSGQPRPQTPPNFGRPQNDAINSDASKKPARKGGGVKGGEYVDFEEVK